MHRDERKHLIPKESPLPNLRYILFWSHEGCGLIHVAISDRPRDIVHETSPPAEADRWIPLLPHHDTMAIQGQQPLCFKFIEDARRLIDEFQRNFASLIVQHSESHASYQAGERSNDANDDDNKNVDYLVPSQSLPCPECSLPFDRRHNLERHWPRHAQCDERCLFCGRDISNTQEYILHIEKCENKNQYSSDSDEMLQTFERLETLKMEATEKLDELLLSRGKGRKRRRKTKGPINDKFRLTKGDEISNAQALSLPPQPSLIQNADDATEDALETSRVEAFVNPAIPEHPAFAMSYTIDQSNNPVNPQPPFAAPYPIVNPDILEHPAFALSYTIDQSADLDIPEQPAFAASYTIDQSINLIPEQPVLASSCSVVPSMTDPGDENIFTNALHSRLAPSTGLPGIATYQPSSFLEDSIR